jgi:tol-pal system protein YbgF
MKYSFLYIIVCLALISGCVDPDQFGVLDQRVAVIEKILRISEDDKSQSKDKLVQIEESSDISTSRVEYAETKYEIERLRESLQQLEGLIEEINQRILSSTQTDGQTLEKTLERLDNVISKNYEKIIWLEKYMGFDPFTVKPVVESPDEPVKVFVEDKPETDLYSNAKKLLDDGDRENARIQFENFINRFPKSKNVDNARFWIADSYFSDKWYEKAILEYQSVLEDYPDSNKRAAALLKQGYAFAELGEKASACLLLKELIKKHPKSNEAKYAQEKLKKLN